MGPEQCKIHVVGLRRHDADRVRVLSCLSDLVSGRINPRISANSLRCEQAGTPVRRPQAPYVNQLSNRTVLNSELMTGPSGCPKKELSKEVVD